MTPDFTGEYVLDRPACTLSAAASGIQSAVMRIEHREPVFRCSATWMADGKTVQDVTTWLQSSAPTTPPPFSDAGGIAAIAPGETAFVVLNLQPGQYMALCYVLDPASGKPHVALGMLVPFTVNA